MEKNGYPPNFEAWRGRQTTRLTSRHLTPPSPAPSPDCEPAGLPLPGVSRSTKRRISLEQQDRSVLHEPAQMKSRLTIKEYVHLIVYDSARHWEGIALARVGPRLRRDQLAKDSVEDSESHRLRTEHDGDDADCEEDGFWDDEELTEIIGKDIPERPADKLTDERWTDAFRFFRQRMIKFVKDMFNWGVLRELDPTKAWSVKAGLEATAPPAAGHPVADRQEGTHQSPMSQSICNIVISLSVTLGKL